MDGLYLLEEGTVSDVRDEMADPPGYDAVRTTLRILEEKGVVRHRRDGRRYVYRPAVEKRAARQVALSELVRTFFNGSAEAAAVALLRLEHGEVGEAELEDLRRRIETASGGIAPGEGEK